MPEVLTKAEIRASLDVAGRLASDGEMADPVGWVDLRARPDETVAAVKARLRNHTTPHRGQVFRWPKETGGYRPMAWIDPLDQLIYRGTVGRLVSPIVGSIDGTAVLSNPVKVKPPRWEFEHLGKPLAERRRRGTALLEAHPVMGVMDIENFFPSVRRPALEDVLGALPLHAPTFEFVLDWLDELADVSGIKGLPTGHQASQVLASGLLVPCDTLLTDRGVPFLRWVDDTWLFLDDEDEFSKIIEHYERCLDGLGLRLHPGKTKLLDPIAALNEVQRLAIAYVEDELREPGPSGRAAGLALFEFALEEPIERKSELRRALTVLTSHRDAHPVEALRADPGLLRLAPQHWEKYLGSMLSHKPSRKVVDADWVVGQATQLVTKDDGYANLIYLKATARGHLDRDQGRQVLEVATSDGGWSAPVRAWAAHVWGRSGAFNPNTAVEQVEERGDYCTRRAFALTLDTKRSDQRMGRWLTRVRRAHPELEPTAAWLEAA